MSRPPTPEEIRATNPNMTRMCDKCDLVMYGDANFGTFEHMLTLSLSGGYMEYVDSVVVPEQELDFHLCHECGHKLMIEFFGQWDYTRWHFRTKDKYCDGWSFATWEALNQP